MTEIEMRATVEAFVALPRAERKAKYPTLDKAVQLRVRKIIEGRRGIAYRSEGGLPVLTKEALIAQITQQATKLVELPKRMEVLSAQIEELKAQLLENWGEEALAEAAAALSNLSNA